MRNSTRLRFFLAAASVTTAMAAFIAACGDDDDSSVSPPDAGGSETSTIDRATPDSNTGDTAKPDSGADTGPVYFPGDATVLDGGPLYEGGITCVVGGQVEQEINDDPDAANQLRLSPDGGCVGNGCSRYGVIFDSDPDAGADAGDGGLGGTELEYVTFDLLPTTKSFFIQFGGDVTLTVTVEGDPNEYVITAATSPALPFTLGKHYYVAVKSNTGKQTPWRVTLYETQ